jgi:hypothetical protein
MRLADHSITVVANASSTPWVNKRTDKFVPPKNNRAVKKPSIFIVSPPFLHVSRNYAKGQFACHRQMDAKEQINDLNQSFAGKMKRHWERRDETACRVIGTRRNGG